MVPDTENQASMETVSRQNTSEIGRKYPPGPAASTSKVPASQQSEDPPSVAATRVAADKSSPSVDPFPKTRFGLKKTGITAGNPYDPIAATHDYTVKYKPDELYHELDDNARVWLVYNDEANAFDIDMIEEASDSLDILLVFAGLFSAVLTTFVVQTAQSLAPDNAGISVSLLHELVQLQRAQGNQTLTDSVPRNDVTSIPSAIDRWVNGLWFVSLTLSLSSALFAVLAKQWLRSYRSLSSGTPRDRAFLRQFRFDGFDQWRVRSIIGFLPTILHLSLILFLVGLVLFLLPLNTVIAAVVGAITILLLSIYLVTNLLPIKLIQCPYRTPLTDLVYRVLESFFPSKFIPRDLKEAQRNAVDQQSNNAHEAAALKWLLSTTANPSAKKVAYQCIGALRPAVARKVGERDLLTLESIYQEDISREEIRQDWAWMGVLDMTSDDFKPDIRDRDTGILTLEEKDDMRRWLTGWMYYMLIESYTGPIQADRWFHYTFTSVYDTSNGNTFAESDLDLALSSLALAIAIGRNTNVFIAATEPQGTPVELNRTNVFTWIVDNSESLTIPELPPLTWIYLQEGGKWSLKDFQNPSSMYNGLKCLLKQCSVGESERLGDRVTVSLPWLIRRQLDALRNDAKGALLKEVWEDNEQPH